MNERELREFGEGYWECREVILSRLKTVLSADGDLRKPLESLIQVLEDDRDRGQWESVQREFPGITREEYEAGLDETAETIRRLYYSEAGFRKPRLVRNEAAADGKAGKKGVVPCQKTNS